MSRTLSAAAVVALLVSSAAHALAAPPPARTLENATDVLKELEAIPLKGIPPAMLADAKGVVIVPRVIKAGLVVAGRGGHGVALARDANGNWGAPVFLDLGGASVGFQAGVESTDVVLVFRSAKSLERILAGKEKLTLGADASVAAGPVGRAAMAGTDGKLEAEIYSYSRSRGLFAGVSLSGAVLLPDAETTAAFQKGAPADLEKAAALATKLTELATAKPAAEPAPAVTPAQQPPRRRLFPRPFRP